MQEKHMEPFNGHYEVWVERGERVHRYVADVSRETAVELFNSASRVYPEARVILATVAEVEGVLVRKPVFKREPRGAAP